jgi:hypothetical protein
MGLVLPASSAAQARQWARVEESLRQQVVLE